MRCRITACMLATEQAPMLSCSILKRVLTDKQESRLFQRSRSEERRDGQLGGQRYMHCKSDSERSHAPLPSKPSWSAASAPLSALNAPDCCSGMLIDPGGSSAHNPVAIAMPCATNALSPLCSPWNSSPAR